MEVIRFFFGRRWGLYTRVYIRGYMIFCSRFGRGYIRGARHEALQYTRWDIHELGLWDFGSMCIYYILYCLRCTRWLSKQCFICFKNNGYTIIMLFAAFAVWKKCTWTHEFGSWIEFLTLELEVGVSSLGNTSNALGFHSAQIASSLEVEFSCK